MSTSTREMELEMKRSKGKISCAECRRLKLKCDKKLPCSTCVRRGCESICPNGMLASRGARYILADTEKLHQRVSEMSNRIRQLEDALLVEHSAHSTGIHPLLTDELLRIRNSYDTSEISTQDEDEELRRDFGSLTVTDGNAARFLGSTGVAEMLLWIEFDPELSAKEETIIELSDKVAHSSEMWPFSPVYLPRNNLKAQLLAQLPSWERANALCEAWIGNLSWFHRPIERSQIFEDLLPIVYRRRFPSRSLIEQEEDDDEIDVHKLALLFAVLACGAVADFTLPAWNAEGVTYHYLAKAALGLRSIFDGASLETVQAICMTAVFDVISGRQYNSALEPSWKMVSLAFTLALSIGLHLDPGKWGLDPIEINRRRSVFWELFLLDNWKSLSSGRPRSFSPETIDVEDPDETDVAYDENGQAIPSFWKWKRDFAKHVLSPITTRLTSTRPLKYTEVLELDQKITDFNKDRQLSIVKSKLGNSSPLDVTRHRAIEIYVSNASSYIHRNFFARALIEYPTDPLRSPFAPSFSATYRSAVSLLRILRQHYDTMSHLLLRLWPVWAHALAASVTLGSIVERAPSLPITPAAFEELELAIKLFNNAGMHPVVKSGLPLLLRVRDKAYISLYKYQSTGKLTADLQVMTPTIRTENEDVGDELNILRGRARYSVKKSPRPSTPSVASSGQGSPASLSGFEKGSTIGGEVHLHSDAIVVDDLHNSSPSTPIPSSRNPNLTSGQSSNAQAIQFSTPVASRVNDSFCSPTEAAISRWSPQSTSRHVLSDQRSPYHIQLSQFPPQHPSNSIQQLTEMSPMRIEGSGNISSISDGTYSHASFVETRMISSEVPYAGGVNVSGQEWDSLGPPSLPPPMNYDGLNNDPGQSVDTVFEVDAWKSIIEDAGFGFELPMDSILETQDQFQFDSGS